MKSNPLDEICMCVHICRYRKVRKGQVDLANNFGYLGGGMERTSLPHWLSENLCFGNNSKYSSYIKTL
jgi:hypothetical protein